MQLSIAYSIIDIIADDFVNAVIYMALLSLSYLGKDITRLSINDMKETANDTINIFSII